MINPGSPAHQLTGVFSRAWVQPMSEAFHTLGLKNGVVVHTVLDAERGLDELACCGSPLCSGFGSSWDQPISLNWDDLGLASCPEEDLKGGDLEHNIQLLQYLLDGKAPKGLEDTVALNAGVAFSVVGKSGSILEGIQLAREQLLGGAVKSLQSAIKDHFTG